MRILIVESSHAQRVIIEKLFNLNGHFRVAPIESFAQLLTYTKYALVPFDIVLVSYEVSINAGVEMYSFLCRNENIKNFVIYSAGGTIKLDFDVRNSKNKVTLPGALDSKTVRTLVNVITFDQTAGQELAYREAITQLWTSQRAS